MCRDEKQPEWSGPRWGQYKQPRRAITFAGFAFRQGREKTITGCRDVLVSCACEVSGPAPLVLPP
jgi:hypothetical protein